MLICPACRTTYTSSLSGTCYKDGAKLVDHAAYTEAQRDPMRGRVVGEKYQLIERIGQGGMGTVYRASQAGLRRDVAIKILKPELTRDADTVSRFQREATAMSLLNHPNTTRVYDFGQTDDGLLYLVMELLEGELITQRVTRTGPLPVLEALRVTQQILRSLAEAHAKGIVHRDLKPDNIFVALVEGHETPVIKVLDFGIAKIVAPDRPLDQFETQAGTVFGTPRYMSPEQAQGAQLDARSDLYSVGALFYQMLTGRAPFTDDDAVVVMAKHIRETPPSPASLMGAERIPKSIDDAVMRALSKDPSARFQTAVQFDSALEECVGDAIVAGTPPEVRPRERTGRLIRIVMWSAIVFGLAGVAVWVHRRFEAGSAVPFSSLQLPPSASSASEDAQLAPTETQQATSPGLEEDADVEDDEEVLAPGPDPAVVSIRSEPDGAEVVRGGTLLGTTPINLVVQPSEDIVRIELRMVGYQPLLAELTAKDGERVLKLEPEPEAAVPTPPAEPAPVAQPPAAQTKRPSSGRSESSSKPAHAAPTNAASSPKTNPAPKPDGESDAKPIPPEREGPYERFE